MRPDIEATSNSVCRRDRSTILKQPRPPALRYFSLPAFLTALFSLLLAPLPRFPSSHHCLDSFTYNQTSAPSCSWHYCKSTNLRPSKQGMAFFHLHRPTSAEPLLPVDNLALTAEVLLILSAATAATNILNLNPTRQRSSI